MDSYVNIEPNDQNDLKNKEGCTSPGNAKEPEDKRSCFGCCGMSLFSVIYCCFIAVSAIILVGGLVTIFTIDRKPESPLTPPISPTTTMAQPSPTLPTNPTPATDTPPTSTTVTTPITTKTDPTTSATVDPPTTTSTIDPCIPIQWLKDVPVRPANKDPWRVSLFSGQVPHAEMQEICDKIDKAITTEWSELGKWNGAVYLNNAEEEASFDNIVSISLDSVFENLPYNRRLMWTGCYYDRSSIKESIWETQCRTPLEEYDNFCNKTGWVNELEELKATATEDDLIYIVKDYRENTGCWKLFLSRQIISMLDDPNLAFACITADKPLTSGEKAIELSGLNLCNRYNK